MRKARPRGQAAVIQRTLGQNVYELREAAGMSQEKLASLSSLSRSYIIRIERGAANATIGTIVSIARVFDVTINDLLTRECC
ncbi:MAG TPA: helix-turn-helix transcriptional regulator [Pseudolysinimonas sp.]|jgi:transcriptional regulator with XRE-family HTH domain